MKSAEVVAVVTEEDAGLSINDSSPRSSTGTLLNSDASYFNNGLSNF